MEKLIQVESVAAPLMRINIDTDAIIPSREMKRVSKSGLDEGLFAGWRYTLPGGREPNPDFVLNKPEYNDAKIILAGDNFGCGSSREHAVWALHGFGIRVIIAPSFGSIFYQNCIRNGLLPVCLPAAEVSALAAFVESAPLEHRLCVDLERCVVVAGERELPFEIAENHRDMLLRGLDPIALTLQHEAVILAFEGAYYQARPWLQAEPGREAPASR